MKIAVTGATGFLGRYIVRHLIGAGNDCRCWHRPNSDRSGIESSNGGLEWIPGELGNSAACRDLVAGCDAVVHSALFRPGHDFRGGEGDLPNFVEKNIGGTIQLMEAARSAEVGRFVFISTCAVHERILSDRPLDETHPLWATSHYGAHKAAIEKFVHSYGLGNGWPICAVRPTGIYGLAHPASNSKWYDFVKSVVRGESVECTRGGKEVHAADVAKAVEVLLNADAEKITGEAFSCFDRYVSQFDIATITKELSGSNCEIHGNQTRPKNQIVTDKIKAVGMEFGGEELLRQTIQQLIDN